MKTVEERVFELLKMTGANQVEIEKIITRSKEEYNQVLIWIQQIQLDAAKWAMTEAAKEVKNTPNKYTYHGAEDSQTTSIEAPNKGDFERAILTRRDNLTLEDMK